LSPHPLLTEVAQTAASRCANQNNGHLRPSSPGQISQPLAQTSPERPCPPAGTFYHYVIVRSDLPHGFMAGQIVHAAGESSPGNLPEGTFAIVLAVPDIKGLVALKRDLDEAGIPHKLICEPDLPYNGAPTCIGIVPTQDRRVVRRVLGRLPLLK
jgi:peptidyl-tRNA hydrolase